MIRIIFLTLSSRLYIKLQQHLLKDETTNKTWDVKLFLSYKLSLLLFVSCICLNNIRDTCSILKFRFRNKTKNEDENRGFIRFILLLNQIFYLLKFLNKKPLPCNIFPHMHFSINTRSCSGHVMSLVSYTFIYFFESTKISNTRIYNTNTCTFVISCNIACCC